MRAVEGALAILSHLSHLSRTTVQVRRIYALAVSSFPRSGKRGNSSCGEGEHPEALLWAEGADALEEELAQFERMEDAQAGRCERPNPPGERCDLRLI